MAETSTRRRALLTVIAGSAASTALPGAGGLFPKPVAITAMADAGLIRVCADHARRRAAWIAGPDLPVETMADDPLWIAYDAGRDAIGAAHPRSMAGVLAKARAAKAEMGAHAPSRHDFGSPAEAWAWDIVNDLLRLHGEG